MEDTQIIALYWQRSSDAIRASEEAYGAYCFTVANRIVDNREDAEECVSDTWLRAWYALPPEKPNYLRMFFAAITRNLSLDRVRASLTAKRAAGRRCFRWRNFRSAFLAHRRLRMPSSRRSFPPV